MKLSVCMITYNHAPFIRQAIDSALSQETPFPYEIVIADDYSTDGTAEIVAEYQSRHPGLVRSVGDGRNHGVTRNLARCLRACRGEYVALLEGDDYWTDTTKLGRQAEYLDANPSCAISFHLVEAVDERNRIIRSLWQTPTRNVFTLRDLLVGGNFIPTCSAVFRRRSELDFPDWFFSSYIGDFPLHVMNAEYGDIHFMDRTMGAWRRHAGGVYNSGGNTARSQETIRVYANIDRHLGFRHHRVISSLQSYWQAVECMRVGDVAQARRYALRRLLGPPVGAQSLKALVMALAPGVYRRSARPVP